MAKVQAMFKVKLPVQLKKREKWYLASCSVLDVHSQGTNQKKALNNLTEALTLFLTSCIERGTLDRVLKDCGFKLAKVQPKKLPQDQKYLDIPISLTANVSCSKPEVCHA